MDEAMTLISEGCKMAKTLESNLADTAANRPDHLFGSCTEIITTFTKARESISQAMLVHNLHQQRPDPVQEWLNRSHAMDLLQAQIMVGDGKMKGVVIEDGGAAAAAAAGSGGTLAEVVAPPRQRAAAVAESSGVAPRGGAGSSSSQRPRRRGRDAAGGRRVERVAAPEMGNTEIPPDDGFTWRKYGQKAILHSRFPRSYFRCTHQKLYDCPAKKQVQRQEDDPRIFEITYLGLHTCHYSSTAPSAAPPPPQPPQHHQLTLPPDLLLQQQTHHLDLTTPAPAFVSQWLSMDIAGPSTSAAAYQPEYLHAPPQPVADMADAMFNSGGSSSNNSMDLIFSTMDHHQHNMNWDPTQKKN